AMSGSYDRFSGRPQPQGAAAGYDPYDDPVTGSPTGPAAFVGQPPALGASRTLPADDVPQDLYAPTRDNDRGRKMKATAPVVPPASVTGRSLNLVIVIMCFLACLTAGTVWMIKQSSDAWLKDIASEVTAQIEPRPNVDTEKTLKDATTFLERRPGIARASALSLDESSKPLEPWLGQSDVLAALPVPRLIAIEIDRQSPPNIDTLRADLAKQFPGASLDDHRHWQRQIVTVTRSFALGGIAILLLVAAATTAIIVSATRSALASNREIVEVLHFVGATDRYIAREFEKHFLRLGIRAGLVGAVCAAVVFFSMTAVMQILGGGDFTVAEVHRLIGNG
ncbi:MAG: ABC transporter permease, partial [Hyphomicrobium sp.]